MSKSRKASAKPPTPKAGVAGDLAVLVTKPAPKPKAPQARQMTAATWGRGTVRTNPLVCAFVAEHERQRTVKRSAAEWMALYLGWSKEPRG